jgi:hypothetical protein
MGPTLTNIHKINMKGTLLKENNQWIVEHWEGLKVKEYPLLPKDATSCLDGDKGKEIEFEIVKEYIDSHTNQVQNYAKLIPLKEGIHLDTWNEIFAEIEGSLHASLPLRVKNWLRNKFNPPTLKSS